MRLTFGKVLCAVALAAMTFSCTDKQDNPINPQPPEESTQQELTEDFEDFASWITDAVKRCHPYINTFWGAEADPANFNLLLTDEDLDKLYLIDTTGKREVPKAEWTSELQRGLQEVNSADYYFLTFQDRHCCLQVFSPKAWKEQQATRELVFGKPFTLQDYAYDILSTFYHESFHTYVQKLNGWVDHEPASSRDQTFPVAYEPRLCRKLAFLALIKAWQEPEHAAEQYARAQYWTQKYKAQFAKEAQSIKATDIFEGTAEYFGRSIVNAVFPDYQLLHGTSDLELSNSVEHESYQLSIALQLIRRDNRLQEAVEIFKDMTTTPLDFLLSGVTAPADYDESQDADDLAKVRTEMDKFYSESNPFMAPVVHLVNQHASGKVVYLVVKNTDREVYTSSQGNYSLTDFPGFACVVNLQGVFDKVEYTGATLLRWSNFFCMPLSDAGHLQLSAMKEIPEMKADFSDVTFTREATLSGVSDDEPAVLRVLPARVMYGTDKLGNEYYVCL